MKSLPKIASAGEIVNIVMNSSYSASDRLLTRGVFCGTDLFGVVSKRLKKYFCVVATVFEVGILLIADG